MSHKEGKSFFRRICSPLEKSSAKHEEKDKHRSSSTSAAPVAAKQQSNGHKRSGSDDVLRIENTAYGDPNILNSIPAPGTTHRSQSASASPGEILNPPLPPRNPPKQPSKMNDESPVYVAPADTLQRGGNNAISSTILMGNYSRTDPISGPPSKNERKVMEMHQLTMVQKQRQEQGQPAQQQQRVQSVIDNSEYSTPYNLLQQQQKASRGRNSIGGAPSRQRRVPQVGMTEEGDQIIPVLSPPPDRSQTTSPSSPLSTPSSEHEEGGGGSGISAGGGDSDYDVPWDRKFKDLPNFNRGPRKQLSGGRIHSLPDESRGDHPPPPHNKMYNWGHPDRNSPPAPPVPPERNAPIGGPVVYQNKGRRTSPQPSEDTMLGGRPRYLPARHQSEQVRPRDGSTSPNQLAGRSYGHTVHGPHVSRDLPPEISPRTSSMSIPPHMSGRRLPSPPRERSESSPVEPGRRGMLRPPSPPNPVHIDFSIPLCDQP